MSWRRYLFTAPCACRLPNYWHEDLGPIEGDIDLYVCLFLWTNGDGLWDTGGSPIDARDLPISKNLMRDIARWEADYDLIGENMVPNQGDAVWEANEKFPTDWFNRRSTALQQRLEKELGTEWTVEQRLLKRGYSSA